MTKTIAVVCALPPNRNTGMFSVDYSACCFFSEFMGAKVNYYTLGAPDKAGYGPDELGFGYKSLFQNFAEVLQSDLIVYWGDFLHAKAYWDADLVRSLVSQGISADSATALDLIYRMLMLEGAPDETLARTVLFGGTIITSDATQFADPRYGAAMRRLVGGSAGVFFRDAFSATKAYPFRAADEFPLGCDAAMLLSSDGTLTVPVPENGRVGIFFGRANYLVSSLIAARSFAGRLKKEAVWHPWLPGIKRQKIQAKAFGFDTTGAPQPPLQLIRDVNAFDVILTDTYHLCVNAWRQGVPAICIGHGAEMRGHTLADKKKEALFGMYNAAPYYIYSERLRYPWNVPNVMTEAAELLEDKLAIAAVVNSFRSHAVIAKGRLQKTCNSVLERSSLT